MNQKESTRHRESQQGVKSESEQKDSGLADSQRAELVSLTDNLNTSTPERSDHQAACSPTHNAPATLHNSTLLDSTHSAPGS